jgi:hypothetical protein
MSTLRQRLRTRRDAARHAQALQRAMRSTTSRAVRDEILSVIGR